VPRMPLSVLALLSATCATSSLAHEGMWLPSQSAVIGAQMRADGLEIDPARLGDLQAAPLNAIVSLGGCSAAFVSPEGLVVTNHHCVYGSLQYNSRPDSDYLTNGFLAVTKSDELPAAPGSRVYVIEALDDVTKTVLAGVSPSMSGRARYDRIDANRKALIAECEKAPNRRCSVRSYYGGAQYFRQTQLEIKDVRLVYAPAGGIGNFGGETDNWMWPRHTGDFGFYRAYVAPDGSSAPYAKENIPYRPKSWLKVSPDGVRDGDFVMVAGFPGSTNRLATAAEAQFAFETYLPLEQRLLSDYADAIMRATSGDDAARITYASILRGADNYKKKTLGELAGADAIGLSARKARDEAKFRDWIAANPERSKRYGPALASLDTLISEDTAADLASLRQDLLDHAQLLSAARTAYRWARERAKPDAEREVGYQDRDRRTVVESLTRIERRYSPRIDRILFEQALSEYTQLPAEDRDAAFEAALSGLGMDRLYSETKLGETQTRIAWLDKSAADFERSDDPFIQLAVALFPGDMARENANKERAGQLLAARARVMDAMLNFAKSSGTVIAPDANGSLRLTWGKVTGKTVDGQIWKSFTSAEGLAAKQTGKGDFAAPQSVIKAINAKDFGRWVSRDINSLPVDFMSSVDITNGNSGSSTLNARGEFVGLAFDGTLDGVISDWAYDASRNRTIHVDSRFMLWVMDKVDHADRLIAEMGLSK